MRVVSWNVNSVRARSINVKNFIEAVNPDALLLQELKCEDRAFPEFFADMGYNVAVYGQKTYNGVAILSKHSIEDVQRGIPGFADEQARYIEAFTGGFRLASAYVPNGQSVGSPAYAYKLEFMERLGERAREVLSYGEKFALGGDFNVAPTDADVYDPVAWGDRILCSGAERRAFFKLSYLGFTDACAQSHKGVDPAYTWWDYREGAFSKNNGLRIDHFLLSPSAADSLRSFRVHKTERALAKASDHAPIECVLD